MDHVSFAASFRKECLQLWEQCKNSAFSLFGLFLKAIASMEYVPVSAPLANRKIAIGGVENVGNSCIFSTMLQDMAAEPAFYDTFFTTQLQQGSDDNGRFTLRRELQGHLLYCITKIREGNLVKKQEVRRLANLLQQLGWGGHLVSAWRLFLNRIAPSLFPIPLFSPYKLFDTILALFSEVSHPSHRIVLMAKSREISFEKLIETSDAFHESQPNTLWKIAVDPKENPNLPEQFELHECQFTLKLVHHLQETPRGNHVLAYRKHNEGWVSCDDTQVEAVKSLPTSNIYSVVYESRLK
jgi:hypothetical protein